MIKTDESSRVPCGLGRASIRTTRRKRANSGLRSFAAIARFAESLVEVWAFASLPRGFVHLGGVVARRAAIARGRVEGLAGDLGDHIIGRGRRFGEAAVESSAPGARTSPAKILAHSWHYRLRVARA